MHAFRKGMAATVLLLLCCVAAHSEPAMAKLEAALTAACPLDGFSVGSWSDKKTWRLDFSSAATAQQRTACAQAVAGFDATAPENQAPVYVLTHTLLSRLTADEYTAIMQAATAQLALNNGQLSLWLDRARTAPRGVDLTDPATVAAKAAFVSMGLLTQARADAVFK